MRRIDPVRVHAAKLAGAKQRLIDLTTHRHLPIDHPDVIATQARIAELLGQVSGRG